MWETLITKMGTTLSQVTNIKEYSSVPKSKLDKFPYVFYKPSGFTNNFETQNENSAVYRFLMVVIVGVSGTDANAVFSSVLPHTVDAIIEQFNQDWNAGTVDGHRVTVKIDSADTWELSQEEDGLMAYAPLNVEIKLLTSN